MARQIVIDALAAAKEQGKPPPVAPAPVTPALARGTPPLVADYVRKIRELQRPPQPGELDFDGRSADELRLTGLLAYLLQDVDSAVAAWTQLDRVAEPDPLVDSALGLAYLLLEKPERAYPRLRTAFQAFPDVGFLATALADAAVQCGDLEKAGRLLEQARGLSRLPGLGGLERIEARYYAAIGRDDLARARYEIIAGIGHMTNGVAVFDYARYLEERGELHQAVLRYSINAGAIGMENPEVYRRFVTAAERWSGTLSIFKRWQLIRSALDNPSGDDSFARLLRNYTRSKAHYPDQATTQPMSESAQLLALARTLDVNNGAKWETLRAYPSILKDLQSVAWLTPWPQAMSGWVEALAAHANQPEIAHP